MAVHIFLDTEPIQHICSSPQQAWVVKNEFCRLHHYSGVVWVVGELGLWGYADSIDHMWQFSEVVTVPKRIELYLALIGE